MDTKKIATIGTFGAALTAMGIAPELQADIINLTFTPSTNPYNPGPTTGIIPVNINEIAGSVEFSQWNDLIGRTLLAAGLSSVGVVASTATISPGTFAGGSAIGGGTFTQGMTGTAFVGFRAGANVGWFSISFGGFGGDLAYLDGQYGSMGEAVHVGVPAPGALALLALGAVGVRRNRKRAA